MECWNTSIRDSITFCWFDFGTERQTSNINVFIFLHFSSLHLQISTNILYDIYEYIFLYWSIYVLKTNRNPIYIVCHFSLPFNAFLWSNCLSHFLHHQLQKMHNFVWCFNGTNFMGHYGWFVYFFENIQRYITEILTPHVHPLWSTGRTELYSSTG